MPTLFGNDRVLLYDVYPWNELGFGVANFGDNIGTKCSPIRGLGSEIGKIQLFIMTHVDTQRTQPPSINTVMRLGKAVNRVQSVLAGRMKRDNQQRLEEGHATAIAEPWLIHPAPYFGSAIVRNSWLQEYNRLTMFALTNIYQHSDNSLALTITEALAKDVWVFFREIKMLLGSELLKVPLPELEKDEFIFTQAHYDAYAPSLITVSIEALDTPGQMFSALTEDDMTPLLRGIPANLIASSLKQYPVGPLPDSSGLQGQALTEAARLVGVATARAAAGGTIGQASDTSPSGDEARAAAGTSNVNQTVAGIGLPTL